MKRYDSDYAKAPPNRRSLWIFTVDPMQGRTAGQRIQIDIRNEDLTPGPTGQRLEVVDYDATRQTYYAGVDLNDVDVLMRGGLEPTESDPRFHQQMVYAVASKVLENFERALGRRLNLARRNRLRLRLLPHAFYGANAYYHPDLNAVLFGYFRADEVDPGPNLPGQTIFTCLSHDIIAHELTHALVHRLRPHFLQASNVDMLAFHEGFSDIVALFQHFSFPEILRGQVQQSRTNLSRTGIAELARQFGYASGSGKALRSAIARPDARLSDDLMEPHARGGFLVAAVFDAFFAIYQRRIRDLIRIATAGTGNLPDADLHPDLVARVSEEATHAAQSVLRMCIRAFDYLPPVDVTFGDFLRALVTADYELAPEDPGGRRESMIEAFRLRGIYPRGVRSLAEESVLWEDASNLPPFQLALLGELLLQAREISSPRRRGKDPVLSEVAPFEDEPQFDRNLMGKAAALAHEYAVENAPLLALDPNRPIQVVGVHSTFRVAPDGQLSVELVAQFAQQDDSSEEELGGLVLRGGTTVVAAADGTIRYVISKPLPGPHVQGVMRERADHRFERTRAFVRQLDQADPWMSYGNPKQASERMIRRGNLAAIHGGLVR